MVEPTEPSVQRLNRPLSTLSTSSSQLELLQAAANQQEAAASRLGQKAGNFHDFNENHSHPRISLSGSPGGLRASSSLQKSQESRRATILMSTHRRDAIVCAVVIQNTIESLRERPGVVIYSIYQYIPLYRENPPNCRF